MLKHHLITPGPTPVDPDVLLAMARPMIHHRGTAFKEIFQGVRDGLQWLFQTQSDVLTLSCTGTGAFEAAIINFTRREDTLVAIGGGKFGERWGEIAQAYGMNVIPMNVEWGQHATPEALAEVLEANPDVSMVTLCASETSTGVYHPVKELVQVVREKTNALIAVDAITALGVHELPMDEWGIDIVVAGSQKAFSLPPGLGFVAVSERAWQRADEADHPRYYLDLRKEKKAQSKNQTAFTAAVSLVIGLEVVLGKMKAEGLKNMIARHAMLAKATREGVLALGLKTFASRPANSVTTVQVPGLDPSVLVSKMKADGVFMAGGQDHLKDSTFRIGHLGFYDESDILTALCALERALQSVGHDFIPGSGVSAAQKVFLEIP